MSRAPVLWPMALPRALRVLAVVALVPALAGCSFSDWWNLRGTVEVELAPQGPSGTALSNFQSLQIAVYGVSMKKAGSVEPYEFSFGEDPLLVDLVATGKAGTRIPMVTNKTNLREFESVTIRIEVVEAISASGRSLPACHPGQPVESRPCVSTPVNGAYRIERPFSAPRGGTATFVFPIAVQYDQPTDEYYIQSDGALAQIIADD